MRINELPKWAIPAACSAISFGLGALVGVRLTDRQYKKMIEKGKTSEQLEFDFTQSELDRELARATYIVRKMRDESDNLISNVRDLATLQNLPVEASRLAHPANRRNDPDDIVVKVKETIEGEVVHIFTKTDSTWDYELEMQQRNPPEPYIIHRDEFFNDECGYGALGDQRTFTWYAGDDILTDEKDVPIYNYPERVGVLRFGHGSGDPNIVYVRNEKEEEEYEIVMDDGSYEEVVMSGHVVDTLEQTDLKHSRAPGKMRRND